MPAPLKNQARFLFEVEGVADPLHVVRFSLREALSELFELELDLASPNHDIDVDALIRQPGALTMLGVHEDTEPRFVHGIVCSASQGRQNENGCLYHVRLAPQASLLSFRHDCRIFQDKTTQQIVQQVFKAAGLPATSLRFSLSGGLPVRGYCVQYRESDWAFVARLLEEDGLFFFFEHEQDSHTLVIGDAPGAHKPIAGDAELPYNDQASASTQDAVHEFRLTARLGPGKFTARDFNFTTPDESLEGQSSGSSGDLEVYEFPGRHDTAASASRLAKVRLQELQARLRIGEGKSSCSRLVPGYTVSLKEHAGALNEGLLQRYLVLAVTHEGAEPQGLGVDGVGLESRYDNSFEWIPASVPFRPARRTPRPELRGVQTAIVVGPGGEEIHTDEHGRVKVQFHWDRQGRHDDASSCWIRVSQVWAGQGWGSMWIPRVGHEVIVDFLDGDPDRPIITGRVYHGNNAPPYPLPDEKTKSTIKSDSSPGGGGSNELRFEDAKGSEEVFLHAQKDLAIGVENDKQQSVGHDEMLEIGHDRHKRVGNNQSEEIGVDKQISVGSNHSESIGANMQISVGANLSEQVGANAEFSVGANKNETVTIASAETIGAAKALSIGAAYQVSVGGAMSESIGMMKVEAIGQGKMVNVGGDSSETVGGTRSIQAVENVSANAGEHVMLSAGKNMILSAGKDLRVSVGKNAGVAAADKLTVTVGDATVTITKNGDVIIKGKNLNIKASGDVKVKGSKIKLN